MNRLIVPFLVVIIAVVGVWYLTRSPKQVLGTEGPPASPAGGAKASTSALQTTPIAELTKEKAGQEVQIEGTIIEECPSTGCWAVIKDETGQIRIDTKQGGFALPLHREGSKIKVVGKLQVKENGDLEISASQAEL